MTLTIQTLDGEAVAQPGDWVAHIEGQFDVLKPRTVECLFALEESENPPVAKPQPQSGPVGNTDNTKRGRPLGGNKVPAKINSEKTLNQIKKK